MKLSQVENKNEACGHLGREPQTDNKEDAIPFRDLPIGSQVAKRMVFWEIGNDVQNAVNFE